MTLLPHPQEMLRYLISYSEQPPPLSKVNSTETVYQYSAIIPTAASPAKRKLERSTLRLNVPQLQRQINLLHTDKNVTRSSPTSPTLVEHKEWNQVIGTTFYH